jgi:hypothetical protein
MSLVSNGNWTVRASGSNDLCIGMKEMETAKIGTEVTPLIVNSSGEKVRAERT